MAIKLIRYADEGFVNKDQTTFSYTIGEPLMGCFAFLEESDPALLSYKQEYLERFPELVDRSRHQRHEISVSEDSLVYVKNVQVAGTLEDMVMGEDSVFIPQEPIVKTRMILGEEFPLPLAMYVKVSLGYVKERLEKLKERYAYIQSFYEGKIPNPKETLSVNTFYADYSECIVNVDFIKIVKD